MEYGVHWQIIACHEKLSSSIIIQRNSPEPHMLEPFPRFAKNARGILIATDVAARGLDIKDVQHVIHYQVPRTSEVNSLCCNGHSGHWFAAPIPRLEFAMGANSIPKFVNGNGID